MIFNSKLFLVAVMLSGVFFVSSCGDSKGEKPREFSPSLNVNEIGYQLRQILIEAEFQYQDGTSQKFRNLYTNADSLAEESVVRKTENDQYTLQINGQKADINVGGSTRFDSNRNYKAEDGCAYVGNSSANGSADFDSLDLDYRLDLELRGSDCPSSIQNEFVSTQKDELDGLHLNLVKKLQDAGLWVHDETKKVSIRIQILGVSL